MESESEGEKAPGKPILRGPAALNKPPCLLLPPMNLEDPPAHPKMVRMLSRLKQVKRGRKEKAAMGSRFLGGRLGMKGYRWMHKEGEKRVKRHGVGAGERKATKGIPPLAPSSPLALLTPNPAPPSACAGPDSLPLPRSLPSTHLMVSVRSGRANFTSICPCVEERARVGKGGGGWEAQCRGGG